MGNDSRVYETGCQRQSEASKALPSKQNAPVGKPGRSFLKFVERLFSNDHGRRRDHRRHRHGFLLHHRRRRISDRRRRLLREDVLR